MLNTGILGRKECEDKIDRLAVDGIEIQRLFKPEKDADDVIQTVKPGMGQGNAMTHAGRPEAFAFLQRIHGIGGGQTIDGLGDLTQVLEQALLACCMTKDPDGGRLQES